MPLGCWGLLAHYLDMLLGWTFGPLELWAVDEGPPRSID